MFSSLRKINLKWPSSEKVSLKSISFERIMKFSIFVHKNAPLPIVFNSELLKIQYLSFEFQSSEKVNIPVVTVRQ